MRAIPGFKVEVRRQGAVVVVAPSGEVDMGTVHSVRDVLHGSGRCDVLVLDLGAVSFMDSSGVGLVVDEHHRAEREGFELRVVAGSEQVRRLFEMTGLSRHLRLTAPRPDSAAHGPALGV